jgi:hypothetical protein
MASTISFSSCPFGAQAVEFFAQILDLFVHRIQLPLVVFAFDGFAFDFQLPHLAVEFVHVFGHGVEFEAEFGAGFVDQVDGFIGQFALEI